MFLLASLLFSSLLSKLGPLNNDVSLKWVFIIIISARLIVNGRGEANATMR